jgi:hypothetical protein
MRSEPILRNERRPAEVVGIRAGFARRVGARLLHEAREALPPTIFFFVGFNFIVLSTNLLAAEYLVAVSNFMLATVAALVVGKAVLVANKMSLLRRYDRAPLIQPILFKTAFYWVAVFLVTGSLCFWHGCSSVSFTSRSKAIRRATSSLI